MKEPANLCDHNKNISFAVRDKTDKYGNKKACIAFYFCVKQCLTLNNEKQKKIKQI